jgi:hypothetical protein
MHRRENRRYDDGVVVDLAVGRGKRIAANRVCAVRVIATLSHLLPLPLSLLHSSVVRGRRWTGLEDVVVGRGRLPPGK